MTLVSVVVPVYERSHCVMDAVASVLAQTHTDIECVVVDDGSTDGSYDVVAKACANEPRVRAVAEEHRGVSATRNRGIREARGEYVTFLDSDDLMPPTRVQRQLELLTEKSCDAVLGLANSFTMPGVGTPEWMKARPDWGDGYMWITFLVATEHIRAVGGFDETLQIGEDIDVLVRMRLNGVRVAAVEETFVLRRFFGDNLTYDMSEHDSALRDAIRRHVARRRAST